MDIVMSIDSAFAPWAATSITALADCQPDDHIAVHILGDERLAEPDRERLRATVAGTRATIEFPDVDDSRVADLPPIGRSGRVIWWRLLLPELFPALDRVLFIDADTFAVRPIDDLWHAALDEMPVAAVANVVHPDLHGYVRSLGVDDPRDYFNAGVVLFDLARMRAENAVDALIETAERLRGRSRWPDQDAMNVVFHGRVHKLHPRFNAMNSLWTWRSWADDVFGPEAAAAARREPAILHFEGPSLNKPWHYLNSHPSRTAYLAALARTPWADAPMQERNLATRAIRMLPERWRTPAYIRAKRLRARLQKLAQR